jgi:hypothetical protein
VDLHLSQLLHVELRLVAPTAVVFSGRYLRQTVGIYINEIFKNLYYYSIVLGLEFHGDISLLAVPLADQFGP